MRKNLINSRGNEVSLVSVDRSARFELVSECRRNPGDSPGLKRRTEGSARTPPEGLARSNEVSRRNYLEFSEEAE